MNLALKTFSASADGKPRKSLSEIFDEENVACGLVPASQTKVMAAASPKGVTTAGGAGKPRKTMAEIFDEENSARDLAELSASGIQGLKFFKASGSGISGDSLPSRFKVLNWGKSETIDGPFTAGNKTASLLAANQRQLGYERIAIDYNHCSVPGSEAAKELSAAGQPPLIFGYGRVNPIAGDGIYLEEVVWTPLGVQHARNFEDLSPALKADNGEVIFMHSVALTPNGKITGLTFQNQN